MLATPTIPPRRRPELIIQQSGPGGDYVVKDPTKRTYFQIGQQEAFLLEQLDGAKDADAICQQFQAQFQEPLSPEELNDFVELAREQRFLDAEKSSSAGTLTAHDRVRNILYWRRSLFDPDRLLNWLEPRTRFLFSTAFFVLSLAGVVWAGAIVFTNGEEFIRYIPRSWEAVVFFWLTVAIATALHELSHGLTCKHYGGEVHEIGVLMMFLMPCFYCDVSDAWLFREKSKRLWVTTAGSYCDLCIWALGVFLWRLTLPQTMIGAFATVVVSVCGARVFLNMIPFLKLDGYYFASDLFELPNMRRRSLGKVADHARWLLWGACASRSGAAERTLLAIGLVTWSFSLFFLVTMLISITHHYLGRWGIWGFFSIAFLSWLSVPNLFVDFSKGEIMKMFRFRHRRLSFWCAALVMVAAAFVFVPMEEKASGPFRVRPSSRAEIRAPVSGFLQTVFREEGQDVEPGTPIVLLEVPDLSSKISEKQAEVNEARAKLTLVEVGPRKEEIDEQRQKAARAKEWRDLAEQDLGRKRRALKDEVVRLSETIRQYTIERENARENLAQSQKLFERKALAQDQLRDWDKKFNVSDAMVKQAEAQYRERIAVGVQDQEAELAKREKECADAKSVLALLEIGTRPEEIAAQRSHLERLEEALAYLRKMNEKLQVQSSIAGVVTTPHLKEKIGGFFKEGDLICEVENIADLEVEIPLAEQEVGHVRVGLDVELKARALPFETLNAHVHRIAPAATKLEKPELTTTTQNTLTVYCRLTCAHTTLHPGMTGYARIYCGQHSMGYVFLARAFRYLRTEVWW